MDQLPDELILMILERLPVGEATDTAARVCRRWASLVRRRVLMLRRPGDQAKLSASLHTLHVLAYLPSLGPLLADVVQYVPRLRDLTIHAAVPFSSDHIAELTRLTHLDHLDVFASARVYDARLAPVVRRLGSLVVNESVAPGLLRAVAADSRLRAIYMYGRSMHYPRRELLTLLRARADRLTELVLRCPELPDSAYEIIGGCSNLTALQLYSCWQLTAAGVLHVTRPRRVRRLHVTGARLVRSPALASLVDQLPPTLVELVLSSGWFGDEHIDPLVARVPTLRTFEAWRCRLTRDGAVTLAIMLPELQMLDLDLILHERHLKMLHGHPNLKILRCLQDPDDIGAEEPPPENSLPRKFRVIPTDARYARRFFRGGNEGFRATLFYYWTRDRMLEPLPPHMQPNFDDDDDMFY